MYEVSGAQCVRGKGSQRPFTPNTSLFFSQNCCDNGITMPSLYLQTLAGRAYSTDWHFPVAPDLLLINLGTCVLVGRLCPRHSRPPTFSPTYPPAATTLTTTRELLGRLRLLPRTSRLWPTPPRGTRSPRSPSVSCRGPWTAVRRSTQASSAPLQASTLRAATLSTSTRAWAQLMTAAADILVLWGTQTCLLQHSPSSLPRCGGENLALPLASWRPDYDVWVAGAASNGPLTGSPVRGTH